VTRISECPDAAQTAVRCNRSAILAPEWGAPAHHRSSLHTTASVDRRSHGRGWSRRLVRAAKYRQQRLLSQRLVCTCCIIRREQHTDHAKFSIRPGRHRKWQYNRVTKQQSACGSPGSPCGLLVAHSDKPCRRNGLAPSNLSTAQPIRTGEHPSLGLGNAAPDLSPFTRTISIARAETARRSADPSRLWPARRHSKTAGTRPHRPAFQRPMPRMASSAP